MPPRSACSISNTCRTGSICTRTATRSMINGGSRERSAEANTMMPRGMLKVHGAPGRGGASSCAMKLTRLGPDFASNGICSWRVAAFQRRFSWPSSMWMRLSGSPRGPKSPVPARMRPSSACSVPSRSISARMTAESGMSAENCPSETRSASIRSFGDTSRMTVSMVRRPSGFGVTVAVADHKPSAPVELTASATPPSAGRVRLRLMCSKLQRLPLR